MNIKKLNGKSITFAYSLVLIILILMAVVLDVSGNALLGNNLDVVASNKGLNQQVNGETQADVNANNESVDESDTTQSTIEQDNSTTNQSSTQSNATQKSNKQASTPQTQAQQGAPVQQTSPQQSAQNSQKPLKRYERRVVVGTCPVVANYQYGDYAGAGGNYDAIQKCFQDVLGIPNGTVAVSGWSDGGYDIAMWNGRGYGIDKGSNEIYYVEVYFA